MKNFPSSFLAVTVNPLTTDDECTCYETLASCYQLAQSVLKQSFEEKF